MSNFHDREAWWFYSEQTKKDWVLFSTIDRDRLEYAYSNGDYYNSNGNDTTDKVAVCAMNKQPFHLADIRKSTMTTLYWFDSIQYDIQRTDWIAIDIEFINNSDTTVTSPAKFIGKERPMTNKWNDILNTLATKNDESWLSFKLFDNENEVSEKSIDLEPYSQGDSEIRDYNLIMRKGVPTVMILIGKASSPSSSSLSSLTSSNKKKVTRIFRGYPAFYSQMVSLLKSSDITAISSMSFTNNKGSASCNSLSPSNLNANGNMSQNGNNGGSGNISNGNNNATTNTTGTGSSSNINNSNSGNGNIFINLPSPFDPPTLIWQPAPKQVVYVVHGIGQKLACKWGYNFTQDVAGLRNLFYDHSENINDILLLPVSWRNILNLDPRREKDSSSSLSPPIIESEIDFEKLLSSITIKSVPTVRSLAGDATLDVMLYMLPEHGERIKSAVIQEILRLNETVRKWHNPNEVDNIKISLIGHSLGAALVTDIVSMTCDHFGSISSGINGIVGSIGSSYYHNSRKKSNPLGLNVDKIFTMGSPLALFLLIKHSNIISCSSRFTERQLSQLVNKLPLEIGKTDFILDCNNFYNIFLPNDPVAYRIEPLIHHRFRSLTRSDLLDPQMIPYSKGGFTALKMNIDEKIGVMKDKIYDWWNVEVGSMQSWWRKSITTISNNSNNGDINETKKISNTSTLSMDSNGRLNDNDNDAELNNLINNPLLWLNNNNRVDYVVRGEIMENQYISAIKSHFRYWFDVDIASFIVKELCK